MAPVVHGVCEYASLSHTISLHVRCMYTHSLHAGDDDARGVEQRALVLSVNALSDTEHDAEREGSLVVTCDNKRRGK